MAKNCKSLHMNFAIAEGIKHFKEVRWRTLRKNITALEQRER
jgi:hypothetical protein